MYSPIVVMDVAALKATELPRLGKPRIKLNVHASHTGNEGRQSERVVSAPIIDFSPTRFGGKDWTNRYESGSATVCQLCRRTWSQGRRRRGKRRTSSENWTLRQRSCIQLQ